LKLGVTSIGASAGCGASGVRGAATRPEIPTRRGVRSRLLM